ncbi:MAG: hypothetical protein QM723_08600 [Myxococcaceae bacterium]
MATHLDFAVVELLSQLRTTHPMVVRLAEERGRHYELITPQLVQRWGRGVQVADRSQGRDFEEERSRIMRLLQF